MASLNASESGPLPPPVMMQPGRRQGRPPVNIALNFSAMDANGDGKVTPAEVAAYYRQNGGGGAQIDQAAPAGLQSATA